MRPMIRNVALSKLAFGDLLMVKADPKNALVTLPEPYLIAIGKVCVQWTMLENMVDMILGKLAGMDFLDPRAKIMVAHMSWPQKMDVLGSLIDSLSEDHPRLRGYKDSTAPLLKAAQEGRNHVIHGFYGFEGGKVERQRATARGKLKIQMEEVTVGQIEAVVNDIHAALAAIYNLTIGT